MTREHVVAHGPWAKGFGYARAVRVGNTVEVSGTVAIAPDGTVLHPDDPYGQTKAAIEIILEALAELGAQPADVVRTRVFLRDIDHWRESGRAHAEVFGEILPVSTCVGSNQFLLPELLVEIEATAILSSGERAAGR